MQVDPLSVGDALDFETRGLPAEIADARDNARKASRKLFSLDAVIALWDALRSLRDATVAAGAPAPVIAYAQPAYPAYPCRVLNLARCAREP